MTTHNQESALITLFGATGNLAQKKLYPALYSLFRTGHLSKNFAVVGLGRRKWTKEQFDEYITSSIRDFCHFDLGDDKETFLSHFYYFSLDVTNIDDYRELLKFANDLESHHHIPGNRLFYLAISPSLFESVSYHLQEVGMLNNPGWRRVIIEKPFGHDQASAQSLNQNMTKVFKEDEIFRIDHYLGKQMVQNIEVLRFANSIFEPLWSNQHIENIQITSSESVGIENRGEYYDKSGALRDMVQNHMLQMMTMIAMEPPATLHPEAVRNEKVKLLQSIRRYNTKEDVEQNIIRAQYASGTINGEDVQAYRDEVNVQPDSDTETFVAARLYVDNFRWAGVPFYLQTGKRLPKKSTEIIVQFRSLPHIHFNEEGQLRPNLLKIRVQPNDGMQLIFHAHQPNGDKQIDPITMDFSYGEYATDPAPEAYESLMHDCLRGDSTYFTRWDEVEIAWEIVDAIHHIWQTNPTPLYHYPAGEWGPLQSTQLMEDNDSCWWHTK